MIALDYDLEFAERTAGNYVRGLPDYLARLVGQKTDCSDSTIDDYNPIRAWLGNVQPNKRLRIRITIEAY